MFPIRDDIPSRSTPFVNIAIIILCTAVFFAQLTSDRPEDRVDPLVEGFGMVPVRVMNPGREIRVQERIPVQTFFGAIERTRERVIEPAAVPDLLTLLTCIFLHGGWLHFLGNMWFLWIFGDNVEDRLGHFTYLLFYLAAGLAASLMHLLTNLQSIVPTIGASGAIAGVMGAYLLLYPRARVLTLVPIFIIIHFIAVPAPIFLGIWFFIQLFNGLMTEASVSGGGVAWWAHIGGFVAGVGLVLWLKQRGRLAPPRRPVRSVHWRVR